MISAVVWVAVSSVGVLVSVDSTELRVIVSNVLGVDVGTSEVDVGVSVVDSSVVSMSVVLSA